MITRVELMSPKERILSFIEASADKTLGGKKSMWRSRLYLRNIGFGDVMDVVLYYISLQPDFSEIARIESHDFYKLLKNVWGEWKERVKKQWGYGYYEYPLGSGQTHKTFRIYDIDDAWSSGPGPIGGTMGAAEQYAYLFPGFMQYRHLLPFFSYPEEVPGGWPSYRERRVKALVFPKWRRKMHGKKLEMVFRLAEMVCQGIRENRKQT